MRRVFVCSPYRASNEYTFGENVMLAERLCRAACLTGVAPFAPHLLYTRFLSDEVDSERLMGMKAGTAWMAQADEMWIYADGFDGCSVGMQSEIELAMKLYIPPEIVYRPKAWEGVPPRVKSPQPARIVQPVPELGLEAE